MDVKLPPGQEEFIHRKIAAGEFDSPAAVISEGIRLLEARERWNVEAGSKIEEGWQQAATGMLLSEAALMERLSGRKSDWRQKL